MRFIIASKKDCPFCIEAKSLLNKHQLNYANYNLEEAPILRNFMKDLGYNTVPQVWIRPTESHKAIHIGGYDDLRDYVAERYSDTSY